MIVIGNRMLALGLLSHEGIHGNLHPNLRVNDFISRYFCAFPVFVSFSKYRRLHLLHHGTVGSDKWDPDRHLYAPFPQRALPYLTNQFYRLVTFRTFVDFLHYYNELPDVRKRDIGGRRTVLAPRSDLIRFVLFHVSVVAVAGACGILAEYFLFIIVPIIFVTQPYVYLMGGLQHGPVPTTNSRGVSRSIRGSKLYMWLLLPCDICFHANTTAMRVFRIIG